MIEPIPTPTFDSEEDLAAFQALFNRPAYDPAAALEKARAIFPPGFNPDTHWLAFALILTNGGLEWVFGYMDWRKRVFDYERIKFGALSGGEYTLLTLALHLLNNFHKLPDDGLINLRRLDDWHFELAMHALRIHSRGVNPPSPARRGEGGEEGR